MPKVDNIFEFTCQGRVNMCSWITPYIVACLPNILIQAILKLPPLIRPIVAPSTPSIENITTNSRDTPDTLVDKERSTADRDVQYRYVYALFFFFFFFFFFFHRKHQRRGDGEDDEDTNTFSASCSFYSYAPHFPPPFLPPLSHYTLIVIQR